MPRRLTCSPSQRTPMRSHHRCAAPASQAQLQRRRRRRLFPRVRVRVRACTRVDGLAVHNAGFPAWHGLGPGPPLYLSPPPQTAPPRAPTRTHAHPGTRARATPNQDLADKDGANLFITGSGGVGKSVVTRKIIRALRARHAGKIMVTAPTGCASINVSTSTAPPRRRPATRLGLGTGGARRVAVAPNPPIRAARPFPGRGRAAPSPAPSLSHAHPPAPTRPS